MCVGLRFAEDTIEFGLGAGMAGRGQSLALHLALVAPAQPLAELLGAVAFLGPPHQDAQARRAWGRLPA